MQPDEFLGAAGRGGQACDGDRRGIRGKDDFRPALALQGLISLGLRVEFFRDRLDDEFGAAEFGPVNGDAQPSQILFAVRVAQPALFDVAGEPLGDLHRPAVENFPRDVAQQHRVAVPDEHLRDAGAHRACANHCNGLGN